MQKNHLATPQNLLGPSETGSKGGRGQRLHLTADLGACSWNPGTGSSVPAAEGTAWARGGILLKILMPEPFPALLDPQGGLPRRSQCAVQAKNQCP